MIDIIQLSSGSTTGGAGVSTANADTTERFQGEIMAVHLTYNGTPPATTDVTLATSGEIGGAQTILSLPNAATDGWFYPSTSIQDNTGTAVLYAATFEVPTQFVVADKLNLLVAQANDGDSVDAVILIRK